jgi:hypothetical protein
VPPTVAVANANPSTTRLARTTAPANVLRSPVNDSATPSARTPAFMSDPSERVA